MATKEQLEAALERARRAAAEGVRLAELDAPTVQHVTPMPPRARIVDLTTPPECRPHAAARAVEEIRNDRRRLRVSLGEMLATCKACGKRHDQSQHLTGCPVGE